MLVGGEGIFNTVVRGSGKVILQTMPISKVAELLTPFFTKINKGRTHEKEKETAVQTETVMQTETTVQTETEPDQDFQGRKDLNLVYLPCIIRKNGSTTKKECRICGNAGK